MKYKHLTKEKRLEIDILLNKGYTQKDIAQVLKVHRSTISREIKRNSVERSYDGEKASHKAYIRRMYSKYQCMKILSNMKLREYIEKHLRLEWSPSTISGRIAKETKLEAVSAVSIYKYIRSVYGRQIEKELDLVKKKKKYSKKQSQKVLQLEDRVFIDKRNNSINNRETYGHWEGDFIVSGKTSHTSLLVLYERKSRYTLIKKISSRNEKNVFEAFFEMIGTIKNFESLTLDNDIAFRKHRELSEKLDTTIYFCHPYHSWEKGGVEYTNRLIRRYIPKGSDISQYTNREISEIQNLLNTRPRKCIQYATPEERMLENRQLVVSPLDYV